LTSLDELINGVVALVDNPLTESPMTPITPLELKRKFVVLIKLTPPKGLNPRLTVKAVGRVRVRVKNPNPNPKT